MTINANSPASAKRVQGSSATGHDSLLRFLDLSHDIQALIRHENAILLEKGELSFEAYLTRKVSLMTNFEAEARKLLEEFSGQGRNMQEQAILVEEIQRVRDAMRINSGYQIETIRARMREKFASPDADALFSAPDKEGSACH